MILNEKKNLSITIDTKIEQERLVLILASGIAVALRGGAISIDEAENFLFNPYSISKLRNRGFDQKIIDIIHLGTELEDIKSLIPDHLDEAINNIYKNAIDALKKLPGSAASVDKWID
jgi:hypothetical protein